MFCELVRNPIVPLALIVFAILLIPLARREERQTADNAAKMSGGNAGVFWFLSMAWFVVGAVMVLVIVQPIIAESAKCFRL